ncbi:MAG: DUF6599 family protein [Planctomycetota bacterium]
MPRRLRPSSAVILLSAIAITVCTGCRKNSQDNQPEQPTAAAPAHPNAESPAAAQPPAPSAPAPGQSIPEAEGVDHQDSPGAPACLPASGDVDDWIKHRPIRVVAVEDLAEIMPEEDAHRISQFRVKTAASCAYAMSGTAGPMIADVLVAEAETPEEAYGLMSTASGSSDLLDIGGETRVEDGSGLHLHCWQGHVYVHIWTDQAREKAEADLRRLLLHITGHVTRTGRPEILEAMPRESARPGKMWLVRQLSVLSPEQLGLSPALDFGEITRLLGLSSDTLMCIAAYDVPQAKRPNTVWLVRYPDEEAASRAYMRYSARIDGAAEQPWLSMNLLKPHGRFLIGTWTAEEESLQFMMPRINQLLP